MKKTLISLVLVFALLSTCVFSAVFAAYTTSSDTHKITATVSAFGITAVTINETANNGSEHSNPFDLVPGGKGTLVTTSITGTPSVAAVLKFDVTENTFITTGNWTADGTTQGAQYFPITFTVLTTDYAIGTALEEGDTLDTNGDNVITDIDELFAVVERAIKAISIEVVGEDGEGNPQTVEILKWKWVTNDQNTAKDNALSASTPGFELKVTATVTQKPTT